VELVPTIEFMTDVWLSMLIGGFVWAVAFVAFVVIVMFIKLIMANKG